MENNGLLRVFKLTPTSSGGVSVVQVGQSAGTFPYSSGSPTVTSSGTDGSSAVVWTVYSGGPTGAGGELRAYAALPTSTGTLAQLWSAPLGTVVKFAAVTTDGGRLYAGRGTASCSGSVRPPTPPSRRPPPTSAVRRWGLPRSAP